MVASYTVHYRNQDIDTGTLQLTRPTPHIPQTTKLTQDETDHLNTSVNVSKIDLI